jgi:hypothetical protein
MAGIWNYLSGQITNKCTLIKTLAPFNVLVIVTVSFERRSRGSVTFEFVGLEQARVDVRRLRTHRGRGSVSAVEEDKMLTAVGVQSFRA